MSTGAIFGSRALRWMALLGVVFALGAAQAVAQVVTVTVPKTVDEGGRLSVAVTAKISVKALGKTSTFKVETTVTKGDKDLAKGLTEAEVDDYRLPVKDLVFNVTANTGTVAAERTLNGTITVQTNSDDDAEDEAIALEFKLTGVDGDVTTALDSLSKSAEVTINDTDEQTFVWTPAAPKLEEGSTVRVTLTADPKPYGLSHSTALSVDLTGYTLSPATHTFNLGSDAVTVTITAPSSDENRVDDTLTLRAVKSGTATDLTGADPLKITVTDINKLPTVTATAKMTVAGAAVTSVAEGKEVMLTFAVAENAKEKITITLTEASTSEANMPADYSLSAMTATIAKGGTSSAPLTLTVKNNGDITDEKLVLNGAVTGEPANGTGAGTPVTVTLTITDETVLNVTPKTPAEVEAAVQGQISARSGPDNRYTADDGGLNFSADDFFNLPMTGFDIAVTLKSSNEDSVYTGIGNDGPDIRIYVDADEEYNKPGTATITVTAVVSAMSTVATSRQNSANSATVTFDVTVHEPAAAVVTKKSAADVMAAYMAARTAAAGADGVWTASDGPATIALNALFDNLPATGVSADATSSASSVLVASVSSSDGVVLTPVSAGDADVTVTANGVSVMFLAMVDPVPPPTFDTRGKITVLSIAGTTEKTIDGTKRMHLTEGGITTATVTVTWTNEQLTALWLGKTPITNPPDPAVVYLYDTSYLGSVVDPALGQWLSLAETSESSGTGSRGGNDVVFGARNVEIKVPARPKATASPSGIAMATGTTSVSLPHDDDAEAEAFQISWYPDGSSGVLYVGPLQHRHLLANTHVIEDDEPQGIKLTRTPATRTIYEGGADVKFTAVADPAREDLDLDIRYDLTDSTGVSVSSQTYTLASSIGTIGIGPAAKHEAVLNLAPNDGDRMDDMLQMHAEVVSYALDTGAYGDVGSKKVDFTVMDVHKLPLLSVMPETATLMEGNKLELTLTVDRNPAETRAVDPEKSQYTTEALSIAVMGTGAAGGYSLSSTAVAVPKYEHKAGSTTWMQSVKVTVEATADEAVEGDSMLMLDFVVNGTVAANGPSDTMSDGAASVTIQDATATLVSVRDNAYDIIQGVLGTPPTLMTGMSGEFMGANLFDYDASAVSVTYGTSVEGGAVTASASGGAVTIAAVMAGEAKVTITATATPNASSLVVNQTKDNVAQLTFPVMVEDEPLTFSVMGPDDMNVSEGMSAEVTVMTNRPVGENMEVMLMRDGSSSASDVDYKLTPPLVTILAGQMSGSTMVMAVDDGMAEETEMLMLFLVVDGMQMTDKSVSFYIWDTAVPALPLIAQLLLAALLGLGGYRRYLRR